MVLLLVNKVLLCGTPRKSLLADKVLKPLEDFLHGIGYSGYIDVNCIIDDKGNPWPLEFTTRPGWPLFQIQQALHLGDPIQWMLDSLNGKDTFKVRVGLLAVLLCLNLIIHTVLLRRKRTQGILFLI